MLEPRLEGNRVKVAGCPLGAVLRGGGRSNPVSLPDLASYVGLKEDGLATG